MGIVKQKIENKRNFFKKTETTSQNRMRFRTRVEGDRSVSIDRSPADREQHVIAGADQREAIART